MSGNCEECGNHTLECECDHLPKQNFSKDMLSIPRYSIHVYENKVKIHGIFTSDELRKFILFYADYGYCYSLAFCEGLKLTKEYPEE